MSKIKLQNVNSMNHGIANGPMDGELDLGESGILDESGMMDDSGNVPQIYDGYEYFQVVVEDAIFIRYVVMWNSGNLTGNNIASVKISLDDGCNPMESGNLGEPIVNADPDHYDLIHHQINNIAIIGGGAQITGSCTVEYIYYPCGKMQQSGSMCGRDCTPKDKFYSQLLNIVIPTNEEE